jgi:hypothetical protein
MTSGTRWFPVAREVSLSLRYGKTNDDVDTSCSFILKNIRNAVTVPHDQ